MKADVISLLNVKKDEALAQAQIAIADKFNEMVAAVEAMNEGSSNEELEAQIAQLRLELDNVKAELEVVKAEKEVLAQLVAQIKALLGF